METNRRWPETLGASSVAPIYARDRRRRLAALPLVLALASLAIDCERVARISIRSSTDAGDFDDIPAGLGVGLFVGGEWLFRGSSSKAPQEEGAGLRKFLVLVGRSLARARSGCDAATPGQSGGRNAAGVLVLRNSGQAMTRLPRFVSLSTHRVNGVTNSRIRRILSAQQKRTRHARWLWHQSFDVPPRVRRENICTFQR
jgi:hypothetical protein